MRRSLTDRGSAGDAGPSRAGGGADDAARVPGLAELREVTPPPSLVAGVMRRIAEPPPPSLFAWLRRRRRFELAFSPLDAGVLALVAACLVLSLGHERLASRPESARLLEAPAVPVPHAAAVPEASNDATVLVRFVLVARGARQVAVAGDFNAWDPERIVLENQDGRGTFAATVRLPRGAHQYMFVVDGRWMTDPTAAERRPDGFGRDNAVLRL